MAELRLGVADGYDDPRLFLFRGRLHVSFSAIDACGVRMGYAKLFDDFTTDAVYFPQFTTRNADQHEKNWAPFESDQTLHFIYSIRPHIVLRIEGDRVSEVFETPTTLPWSGGYLRGGAPPVLVDGEYWHWFHGAVEAGSSWPLRRYNVGLYTFEAEPPFRVTRLAPHPLLRADDATRPAEQHSSVIFPAGALFDGRTWRLSSGVHDRAVELRDYSHAEARRWLRIPDAPCLHRGELATAGEIARAGLNPVVAHHRCRVGLGLVTECKSCSTSPKCNSKCAKYDDGAIPFGWQWPDGGQPWETGQWESIVRSDEYRLRGMDLHGGVVLDIGAYAGTFAHTALSAGAARVVCYEPNPDAMHCLVDNLGGRAEVHTEAVGRPGWGHVAAWSEESTSKTVRPGTDGTVRVVGLDTILARAGERIRLLKIDCEGGEWPALLECTMLDRIDAISGEYHRAEPGQLDELRVKLGVAGFRVETTTPDVHGTGTFWARR